MHTHTFTRTCTHTHAHTHPYNHTHTHTHAHTHTHTHTHKHTHCTHTHCTLTPWQTSANVSEYNLLSLIHKLTTGERYTGQPTSGKDSNVAVIEELPVGGDKETDCTYPAVSLVCKLWHSVI